MTLLICNSNLFVPHILTKVLNEPSSEFIVLVDQECLEKLFNFLNLSNIHLIRTINPSPKTPLKAKRIKQKLLDDLGCYHINDLIFFHNEFGDITNWLIQKLSPRITVYHAHIYDNLPYPKASNSLNKLKLKIKYLFLYNTSMDILYNGSRLIPSLPKSFFIKNKIQTIQYTADYNIISNFINNKLQIEPSNNKKNILLTGSVVATNQVNEEIYTKYIDNIINYIGTNNILSKCHPRFNDLFGEEKNLQQIPSFIPANIILNNFQCFIGFNSTLLVEAAINGKIAISLIDFIPSSNEMISKNWHIFFNNRLQGKGIIYYPKNLEELSVILHYQQ